MVASSQKTDVRPEHQLYHEYTTDVDQARTNVHYEQPPEFFLLITGGEWNVYSANLWDPGTEDDTASQQAKLDLIARLAGLERGMRLIDVGCGWAGPLTYLCDTYGLTGTGLTLSPTQKGYAEQRIARRGTDAKIVLSHWEDYTPEEHGRRDLHRRGDRPLLQPRRVLHQVPRLAQARRRDDQQGAAPQASAPRHARTRRRVREPDLRRHRQLPNPRRGDAARQRRRIRHRAGAPHRAPALRDDHRPLARPTCTSTPTGSRRWSASSTTATSGCTCASPGTSSAT